MHDASSVETFGQSGKWKVRLSRSAWNSIAHCRW